MFDNITELRKRIPGGKYALTRAIAERARQLQSGATPLVRVTTPNPITVAIDEVLEGKINFEFRSSDRSETGATKTAAKPKRATKAAAKAATKTKKV